MKSKAYFPFYILLIVFMVSALTLTTRNFFGWPQLNHQKIELSPLQIKRAQIKVETHFKQKNIKFALFERPSAYHFFLDKNQYVDSWNKVFAKRGYARWILYENYIIPGNKNMNWNNFSSVAIFYTNDNEALGLKNVLALIPLKNNLRDFNLEKTHFIKNTLHLVHAFKSLGK